MSEQSYEQPSHQDTERKKGSELKWDVRGVQELREKQKKLVRDAVEGIDPFDREALNEAKQEVYTSFDERARAAVRGSGMEEDDPRFDAQVKYLRHFSVDNMSNDEWYFGNENQDGTLSPSGRDIVRADYESGDSSINRDEQADIDRQEAEAQEDKEDEARREAVETKRVLEEGDKVWDDAHKEARYRKEIDSAWDDAHQENREWDVRKGSIERLEGRLEGLSKARDEAFAERMRLSGFARKNKKEAAQAKFEESEAKYLAAVREHEAALVGHDRVKAQHKAYSIDGDDVFTRTKEESVIEAELKQALTGRINDRFKADEDGRIQAMIEKNGRFAELLNKYANLSRGKKIGVAALTGAGFVAGGAVVAATAGLGAGLLAAGGSGALAAGRFGRGYAVRMSQLYKNRNANELPKYTTSGDASIDTILSDNENEKNSALNWFKDRTKEEIESGDKTKRAAVYAGVGSVALGATLANADEIFGPRPVEWFKNPFGGADGEAPASAPPADPETTPSATPETPITPADLFNGSGGGTEFTPEGLDDFNQWIDGREVDQGDTIWGYAEDYLEAKGIDDPTNAQIDAVKDDVLAEMQERGLADEKGWLSAGDTLDMTPGEGDTGSAGGAEGNDSSSRNDEAADSGGDRDATGGGDSAGGADTNGEAPVSPEETLRVAGLSFEGDNLTYDKSATIMNVAPVLNDYLGINLSPAQYGTALGILTDRNLSYASDMPSLVNAYVDPDTKEVTPVKDFLVQRAQDLGRG